MKLTTNVTTKGEHKGIHFEICHWGIEQGMNDSKGCWNYYIYIFERNVENFADFWLEGEVKEFSKGGTKYLSYDYYSSPLHVDAWHGGITYWEALNERLIGQRCLKIGCDYSHLWDAEQGYPATFQIVLADTIATIEQILPLLRLKER